MRKRYGALGWLLTAALLLLAACGSPQPSAATPSVPDPISDTIQVGPAQPAISAGNFHTCALTSSGGVKCWGNNFYGQLGNNSTTTSNVPVDVSGLSSGVTSISAGYTHTCALTSSGGVKCWGLNNSGQLGNNSTTNSNVPVDVSGLGSGVSAISGGDFHTCALLSGGGVKCWGENFYGQLGNNSTTNSPVPVDVSGLSSGVTSISAGYTHTCALLSGGGVKCWGYNLYGQLGNNSNTNSPVPVDVSGLSSGVTAISTSDAYTCALLSGGGVKCWGFNSDGQLGNNSTTSSNVPVDVSGLSSGVTAISAGDSHTCALTSSGGVKCWGLNSDGQLGNNSTTGSKVPVDVSGLSSGVTAISAGDSHTCALLSSGGVKCWGNNFYGQLGNNSITESNVPVDVSGLSNGVTAISAGDIHTCALTSSGGVKCWGWNSDGRLGNNSTNNSNVPVDVSGLSSGVTAISAGVFHTCALLSGGGVKCWGDNSNGQLGNNSTTDSNIPVDVSGLNLILTDSTPPSASPSQSPAANASGWNNTNVTLTWNWTDNSGGSGIDNANCTTSSTSSSEGSAVVVSATCKDLVGNTGSASVTLKIDKTAPTLSPSVSPNPVLRNLPATATPNASDGLSGIATQSCPAVSTSSTGAQSVTCTATDRAGNTATASANYTVISSSQALSSLRSQVQGLSGLGFVNRTLLLATLSQAQVFLSNGVRSGAVSSLNTFIGQVDGIRGISGGLTNAQANSLIAQANLIIQSINAGG